MANSRLSVETKVITEGAIMASITAVLALAGVFIPLINPVVMLVWTLPVVVICVRHGMRAGIATITVAGVLILIIATPVNAFNMLLCSVGPALLIGQGFYRKWTTEKTIFYTVVTAILGLTADVLISSKVMGISVTQMFTIEPDVVDEMVAMISSNGLLSSMYANQAEMAESINSMVDNMIMVLPAALVMYGLFTAITNYAVAYFSLRRLKEQVPPFTKLSTFRLPTPFLIGFVAGFALLMISSTYPDYQSSLSAIGQNVLSVFLVLYAFQGFGLALFYIGKLAPQRQGTFKFLLVFFIILSGFSLLMIISYVGVFDAFLDFRGIDIGSVRKKRIL